MSATTELSSEDLLPFEDDSLMEIAPINENFDEKVHEAQEQLLRLRHEQELIEKQKAELEHLSRQQERFITGRTVLAEQMNRSIATLEREAFEAEKRVELYLHTKDSFVRHMEIIESFNPERWSRTELRSELSRALSAIDEAEMDFNTARSRMAGLLQSNSVGNQTVTGAGGLISRNSGFRSSFLNGLAFTLPAMIFSLMALLLYLLLGS